MDDKYTVCKNLSKKTVDTLCKPVTITHVIHKKGQHMKHLAAALAVFALTGCVSISDMYTDPHRAGLRPGDVCVTCGENYVILPHTQTALGGN